MSDDVTMHPERGRLVIPPYRPMRWWHLCRQWRERANEKRLLADLVRAMTNPIDGRILPLDRLPSPVTPEMYEKWLREQDG